MHTANGGGEGGQGRGEIDDEGGGGEGGQGRGEIDNEGGGGGAEIGPVTCV